MDRTAPTPGPGEPNPRRSSTAPSRPWVLHLCRFREQCERLLTPESELARRQHAASHSGGAEELREYYFGGDTSGREVELS